MRQTDFLSLSRARHMYQNRIKSIQDSLPNHEIEALLITSPYNIAYISGIHAFSIEEREARVLITKKGVFIFTDARYTEMVRQKSPFIDLREIKSTYPFSKQLEEILKGEKIEQLGFEEENITYKEVSDLEEKLKITEFIPTVDAVENVRNIKDDDEMEIIRKSCQLTDKAFEYILKLLKPGATELEIKSQLENFIRLEGGDLSFSSIVAFGQNSAIPHHLSSKNKLSTSDIVLLDFGAKIDGYCSDMTRTVFMGKPDVKLERMYEATREAQELSIDYIKTYAEDNFELKKAQKMANSHLGKLGYPDIPHSLGHGVGLQVHEEPMISPYSDEKLKPGMIITVEPGVYIPGLGGVRIEDTCLVTDSGLETLTKSPKELISI